MADELSEMKYQAKSLVERARLGDQNAMAMITRVKEEASKGTDRAKLAFKLLHDYIQANPAKAHGFIAKRKPERVSVYVLLREASRQKDPARFSGDVAALVLKAQDSTAAAVAMADGCVMTSGRMREIAKLLGEEKEQKLFFYCAKCTDGSKMRVLVQALPPDAKKIAKAGKAVGLARKIQGIRSGRMPLARLSPMVAWELGE